MVACSEAVTPRVSMLKRMVSFCKCRPAVSMVPREYIPSELVMIIPYSCAGSLLMVTVSIFRSRSMGMLIVATVRIRSVCLVIR